MNYLKYIEHDAENLQFFLWARAYIKKFDELPANEQKLSPEWLKSPYDNDSHGTSTPSHLKVSSDTATFLKGTGLDSGRKVHETSEELGNPFHTPPITPSEERKSYGTPSVVSSNGYSAGWVSSRPSAGQSSDRYRRKAEGAFDDAGLKWQPCKY